MPAGGACSARFSAPIWHLAVGPQRCNVTRRDWTGFVGQAARPRRLSRTRSQPPNRLVAAGRAVRVAQSDRALDIVRVEPGLLLVEASLLGLGVVDAAAFPVIAVALAADRDDDPIVILPTHLRVGILPVAFLSDLEAGLASVVLIVRPGRRDADEPTSTKQCKRSLVMSHSSKIETSHMRPGWTVRRGDVGYGRAGGERDGAVADRHAEADC